MDVTSTIRKFIIESFLFEESEELDENTSFLETGIIDSTGILELVTFLEESFGIIVEDEELTPENLDSIANLVRYLEIKRTRGDIPLHASASA